MYFTFCLSRKRTFIFVQAKVGVWDRALTINGEDQATFLDPENSEESGGLQFMIGSTHMHRCSLPMSFSTTKS